MLYKRFSELARRADGYYTYTDFLGLMEQTVLCELQKNEHIKPIVFGGCEGAERVIAAFGNPDEIGYEPDFPISTLRIMPKQAKFADRLTHRDFLGALLNLGIERAVLGDIIIKDNIAYLFVLDGMCDYISRELVRVKHTDVTVSVVESLPGDALYQTKSISVQSSSQRCDAIVAKVFHLSRDAAQTLIARQSVFIDGAVCESASKALIADCKVSVRGYGKFIYKGPTSLTKKGKLNVCVELYV